MGALEELARHLAGRRDALLRAWRRRVDDDPELTTPQTLSRNQFHDHIPDVLDDLEARLRTVGRPAAAAVAREVREDAAAHGLHRWQQGFQLREVAREWTHLHLSILEEIEGYVAIAPGVPAQALIEARRLLAQLIGDGVCESATRYFSLRQSEATGQVRELERALAQGQGASQRQGETWREAAHDLRGSLGLVQTVTAALARGEVADPKRAEMVAMLKRGVDSLRHLLEDVLSLARLQAGHERRQVQTFDATTLLTELVTAARPLADERGLELSASGPPSLRVQGDPRKLHRIAQNLLLNALKYTAAGSVTLTWGDSRANDPERWMLCVQDTGPGLPSEAAAPVATALAEATEDSLALESEADAPGEITAPASEDAGAAPGEGIGLSIVKRLCELLDASLELHTEAGRGTAIAVVLPRTYPDPAPES